MENFRVHSKNVTTPSYAKYFIKGFGDIPGLELTLNNSYFDIPHSDPYAKIFSKGVSMSGKVITINDVGIWKISVSYAIGLDSPQDLEIGIGWNGDFPVEQLAGGYVYDDTAATTISGSNIYKINSGDNFILALRTRGAVPVNVSFLKGGYITLEKIN